MVKGLKKRIAGKVRRTIRKQKTTISKERALLRGIKQGVGYVTRNPFGKANQGIRRARGVRKVANFPHRGYFNALSPAHLPLPRAVGGYTVTKTTQIISTNDAVIMFGTFQAPAGSLFDRDWTNTCAVSSVDEAAPINQTSNTNLWAIHAMNEHSGYNDCRVVPSAITVQVMNPNALQNTTGIGYFGRAKIVPDLFGDSRTWETFANSLVSFTQPRLASAGKLALNGIQASGCPYNMSVLADFTPRSVVPGGPVTWAPSQSDSVHLEMEGFSPLFVFNPDKIALQYLVTIEWRTRFDPRNPAYAGHEQHPCSTDSKWQSAVSAMENDIPWKDIAVAAADTGMAAAAVALA